MDENHANALAELKERCAKQIVKREMEGLASDREQARLRALNYYEGLEVELAEARRGLEVLRQKLADWGEVK